MPNIRFVIVLVNFRVNLQGAKALWTKRAVTVNVDNVVVDRLVQSVVCIRFSHHIFSGYRDQRIRDLWKSQ